MRNALGMTAQIFVAVGGALALAGCATPKERVTLLSPAQAGKDVGGVVVEYEDGEAYLNQPNQQAALRGERAPKFKQLDQAEPFYTELMGDLPKMLARDLFYFATGEGTLNDEELDRLQAFLASSIQDRPGLAIEIAAHTDATGTEEINDRVSAQRAQTVLGQVLKRVEAAQIPVSADDIDVVASSWHWARSGLQPGEAGQANRAYRVVVVTVR